MINVYTGEETQFENKHKNALMGVWYGGLALCVVILAGFLTWFYLLDYNDGMLVWIEVIVISVTAIFGMGTYLFFSIPMRRQRKYIKLLGHLEKGLKEFGEGKFLRFSDAIEVRDGVDFFLMITEEWSERRQDNMERKILLDCQKPYPKVAEGDIVMYKTQGNILVEYQVKNLDTQTNL